MEVNSHTTLSAVREAVGLKCHGDFCIDSDFIMDAGLKWGDVIVPAALNRMSIEQFLPAFGKEEFSKDEVLRFNMTCDRYGEGGGKRANPSAAHRDETLAKSRHELTMIN